MKRPNSKKKINPMNLIAIIVVVISLFLTVGFAAFQSSLNISDIAATIRVQSDIRITDVSVSNTASNGTASNQEYNVKNISSTLSLPNANSSVTYEVQITNIGNVNMGILNITGLPSNLTYSTSDYTLKDTLCDDANNSKCNLGSVSTLHITVGYAENGYDSSNTNYNILMNFDFKEAYTITYSGFNSVVGLPTQILNGDTKTATFTATTDIPARVSVSGATSSYNSPILTISNATNNVTVTANSSTTVEVIVHEEDNSTTTITTTENENGSTTTVAVTESESGNTLSETETTTNQDGSSSATTTTYDNSGNETGSTSNVTDSNGNSTTQEVTIVNGNEIVTGYTIDTSENENGGVTVVSGTGVDTGILALDGNAFTIHLVAKYNVVKNGSNSGKFVLAALEPTATGASTYKGFAFSVTKSNAQIGLYGSTSSTVNSSSNKATWGSKIQTSSNLTTGSVSHTLDISYTPGTGNNSGTLTWTIDGNSYTTTNSTNIPSSLSNAVITVGTLGVEHTKDMVEMEIIEFSVTKTVS